MNLIRLCCFLIFTQIYSQDIRINELVASNSIFQDEDGDTALHVCYNAECALLLLACDDCNLTKANNEGLTAEQVHQQELTELINSTTVISIHMNENGSDPPTTTQEKQ